MGTGSFVASATKCCMSPSPPHRPKDAKNAKDANAVAQELGSLVARRGPALPTPALPADPTPPRRGRCHGLATPVPVKDAKDAKNANPRVRRPSDHGRSLGQRTLPREADALATDAAPKGPSWVSAQETQNGPWLFGPQGSLRPCLLTAGRGSSC